MTHSFTIEALRESYATKVESDDTYSVFSKDELFYAVEDVLDDESAKDDVMLVHELLQDCLQSGDVNPAILIFEHTVLKPNMDQWKALLSSDLSQGGSSVAEDLLLYISEEDALVCLADLIKDRETPASVSKGAAELSRKIRGISLVA